MAPSFFAGVLFAETASQLALCGLFVGKYLTGCKVRVDDWLSLVAAGCTGAAAVISATMMAEALSGGEPSKAVGSFFASALVVFPLLLAFGVKLKGGATNARRVTLRALPFLLLVFGVFWLFPPMRATSAHPEGLTYSLSGRLLLAATTVALALAIGERRRQAELSAKERLALQSVVPVLLLCALDSLGVGGSVARFPLVSHAGVFFAIIFAFSALKLWRQNLEEVAALSLEIAQSREALRTSQAAVERMQRELGTKKQLAAVGELAAAIAHEVRNPLAIIMNAVAGLRRPTLQSTDRSTLLGILDEETARLNRLVTDLLRFARPVIIKRSSVSILELARRVEGRLADNHALSVEVPDEPSLRVVQADANLLRLVFDNLVSNAFQAMPDGGRVRVVVQGEQRGNVEYVRIDIIDHGHGMDEQVLERATDPFYTTRPSGTGLGLPIVQRIVEAHGGTIEIESAVGQGTKVTMLLPRLPPADEEVGLEKVGS